MSIDLFGHSNIGSRAINEDYYCIKEGKDSCTAVLCDGLGGHECGEVASRIAAENLVSGLNQLETVTPDGINNVLSIVNDGLIRHQMTDRSSEGMRTTAVGCIIKDNMINYFNVGDSRFYLFRDGAIKYMSKDHSVSQLSVEMGQMSFSDIRGDADRSKLLKVLGEPASDSVGTIYQPVEVRPGDAFLLCSDGFWEYVLEEEMEVDFSKAHSAEEWINFMLVRLLLRAENNNDNFTVIGGIIDGSVGRGMSPLTEDDLNEWSRFGSYEKRVSNFPTTMINDVPATVETDFDAVKSSDFRSKSSFDVTSSEYAHRRTGNAKADHVRQGSQMSDRNAYRRKKRKRVKKILGIPMTGANKIIITCIISCIILAVSAIKIYDSTHPNGRDGTEESASVTFTPDAVNDNEALGTEDDAAAEAADSETSAPTDTLEPTGSPDPTEPSDEAGFQNNEG